MVGKGVGACPGDCSCVKNWTPPPPACAICDPGPCSPNLDSAWFSAEVDVIDVPIDEGTCEDCAEGPIQIAIERNSTACWGGGAPMPCTSFADSMPSIDDWLLYGEDEEDICVAWDGNGCADNTRLCYYAPTGHPPPPVEEHRKTIYISVFLRIFCSGYAKMVAVITAPQASGGTVKVDPTDPSNTVVDGGAGFKQKVRCFEGYIACCGTAGLGENSALSSDCDDLVDEDHGGYCDYDPTGSLTMHCL